MRLAVARDGNEQYVLAAGCFYFAAVDDAATVGQQNNFDEHCRVEGRRAFNVILIAGMKVGKIELMVDQMA